MLLEYLANLSADVGDFERVSGKSLHSGLDAVTVAASMVVGEIREDLCIDTVSKVQF